MIREFNGKSPRIAQSAFVSEAAYVIGDVVIGENSGVWPGAVIRGDFAGIRIGQNTMVEDNCVIHTGVSMEIGDNVIIGHGVVLHGKTIGDSNLIGNNATILENVEIGNYCIVAAGSLLSAGMRVSDHSMVAGMPAKVKKQTSEKWLQRLDQGVQQYSRLLVLYKEQGL